MQALQKLAVTLPNFSEVVRQSKRSHAGSGLFKSQPEISELFLQKLVFLIKEYRLQVTKKSVPFLRSKTLTPIEFVINQTLGIQEDWASEFLEAIVPEYTLHELLRVLPKCHDHWMPTLKRAIHARALQETDEEETHVSLEDLYPLAAVDGNPVGAILRNMMRHIAKRGGE